MNINKKTNEKVTLFLVRVDNRSSTDSFNYFSHIMTNKMCSHEYKVMKGDWLYCVHCGHKREGFGSPHNKPTPTEKQQITIKQEIEMGTMDSNVPLKQQTPLQKLIWLIDSGVKSCDLILNSKIKDLRGRPEIEATKSALLSVKKDAESLLPEERQVIENSFGDGCYKCKQYASRQQYFNETYGQ